MINITYNENDFTKEKIYIQNMKYMMNRLQSMFVYSGLPDSIPENELEAILFKYGSCFITEVAGTLYALPYSPVDDLDVYGNFTKVTVSNVALNLSKVFDIDEGVIADNDYMRVGLFPIMSKYSHLLAENTITIKNTDILLRMTSLITASDNVTKQSADLYLEKLKKGDLAIIGNSPFFEGVKIQNGGSGLQNYIHQFLELHQYLKGSFFNELGLNANFNLKLAPLGANETALNRDFLHPLVDNMKECREKFVNELNERYNLNVTVEFNSSWKLEENESQNELSSELNEITQNAPYIESEGDSENVGRINGNSTEDRESSPPEVNPEGNTRNVDGGIIGGHGNTIPESDESSSSEVIESESDGGGEEGNVSQLPRGEEKALVDKERQRVDSTNDGESDSTIDEPDPEEEESTKEGESEDDKNK